jgi:hypothetical protein
MTDANDVKPGTLRVMPANGFLAKPENLKEAMELCEKLASSAFVPDSYKGKPGDIFAAGMMGAEIGLNLMQALQGIGVINGKAGLYGDIGKAILLRDGFHIDIRDTKETEKLKEAYCKITRPDGQVVERTFTVENAQKAKLWDKPGPWTSYPWRQMSWRAFWFAARDIGADALKGLQGAEELMDMPAETISEPENPFLPKQIQAELVQKPTPEKAEPAPVGLVPQVVKVAVEKVWKTNLDGITDYFISSKDGQTFTTQDVGFAKAAQKALKNDSTIQVTYQEKLGALRVVTLWEAPEPVSA